MKINENPYARFAKNDFILRDELAIDRTILANERTLLAYFRTSLALILSGFTAMHLSFENIINFLDNSFLLSVGIISALTGIAVAIAGLYKYFSVKNAIGTLRNKTASKYDSYGVG